MTTAGKNTMARSTQRQNTSTMRQRTAWLFGVLPLSMLLLAGCGLAGTPASRPTLTNGISHEYIIGAGDVLEILVWKNETLSRTVTVRPDGKISLPLINDVQAAGMTPMQLREQIVQEMKTFKELPEVSIIVIDAKSRVVYLMGQVARPGAYPLGPNATVLQVIAQAGGFTQFADSNNILVIRRGDGTSKEQRIQVSYRSILKGQSTKGDVALQAGDTVIVP
jgi:polysaccharide export outer membrane protein